MLKRAKYGAVETIRGERKFRSRLEAYTYDKLIESGIDFEYELNTFTLLDSLHHEFECWEATKIKGTPVFHSLSTKIRPIKYKPDFVGKNWIIETKGMRTPDFNLKWKLFKAFLVANNLHYTLFLPTSQQQVNIAIHIILNKLNNTDETQEMQVRPN